MKKLFLLVFLACVAASVHAESGKTINYDGQNADSFELDLMKQVLRYRAEEYDDTCTRQVPNGTRNVCGYETRYRQECHEEPGRNDCRTVYDQVCRNVTRTRQECHAGPSRQECSTSPSRQECSNGPARRECTTVPQQVCSTVNGRRECHTSGTRQQCRNVPGARTCHTVPGQRTCRNVPGSQVCRSVPYTDRVCTNQPRQACDWIPSRQVCNSVPYQEHVCHDEVVYRTESYACTRTRQVPYQADRKNEADVQIDYANQDALGAAGELAFLLDNVGNVDLKVKSEDLVFVSKKQEIQNDDDNLSTDARFNIAFVAKTAYLAPVQGEIAASSADQGHIVIKSAKIARSQDLRISLKIYKKGFLGIGHYSFEKDLVAGQFTVGKSNDSSFVDINFASIGAKVKDGKEYTFTVTYKLVPGSDLVTPVGAETSRTVSFKQKI